MKTHLTRFVVSRTLVLLLVALFVFLSASCATVTPADTTEQTEGEPTNDQTAEQTTAVPQTTEIGEVTEPAGADEGENPLRMMRSAQISLAEPVGLKFTGVINKAYLDALTAAYGDAVKVGMLFTATDNLTDNSLAFTVEALDACDAITGKKYEKIEITPEPSESENRFVYGTLTGIGKNDYGRSYSAVLFVEVAGKILRYATYSATMNVASLADAAETALLDLAETRSGKYRNEIAIAADIVRYSPYTPAQRETLEAIAYPDSFTVMSYNLHVYDAALGWEGRNPAKAAETVLSESPDVVGFQEVGKKVDSEGWEATLEALAREGGYTRLTGKYCKYDFEKNEIFFKTDKFNLKSEGTVVFKDAAADLKVKNTENADNSLDKIDRIFHYAVLEHKDTGRKILVVNAHLHYGSTGNGAEEHDKVRRYEIKTLLAWLEQRSTIYPDQIVLGDMNAHYNESSSQNGGTRTMKLFFDAGYLRTSETAKLKGDTGGTLANDNRSTRAVWTFDYVLTKGNFKTAFYSAINNRNDVGDTYPSDHLPVIAKIALK